jgi:hypothetical protein
MLGIPVTAKAITIVVAVAIAALVACNGGWALYAYTLRADVTAADAKRAIAETALESAQTDRDTNARNVGEANRQHSITSASLADTVTALQSCQQSRDAALDANTRALAAVEADLVDANRTLAAISTRYQTAMRDPECQICAGRAICPALRSTP